ncbi:MAG: hypothetical protein H7338_22735 [Candidatus Sericytochromatia bacterium]|nr:hypothetical protein [Candidatus Sericytochromatia bacterium]
MSETSCGDFLKVMGALAEKRRKGLPSERILDEATHNLIRMGHLDRDGSLLMTTAMAAAFPTAMVDVADSLVAEMRNDAGDRHVAAAAVAAAVIVTAGMFMAGCFAARPHREVARPRPPIVMTVASQMRDAEAAIFAATNRFRQENGLLPLDTDESPRPVRPLTQRGYGRTGL